MAAEQHEDTSPSTEIECEIDDLIEEHGSERAAIRALLHDMTTLLIDADRSASHGYLRGYFSQTVWPRVVKDES